MLKFSSAGALTEYRYTVADDVVIVQRDSATASSEATYFLFKDHLGSVFTTLASTGAIVSQQVFSAFGQTRSIHTSSALSLGLMMAPTEQGFTGHRQMDALGIVHMKGRIYDPTIGRFLQADPFIQAPKNSQNYNRYSYVLNNPMSYTDPSGYFFKSVFNFVKKYWRQITAIVIGVYAPYLLKSYLGVTSAVTSGAITGLIAGGVATGSLRGAVIGAFTGAIFGRLHSMEAGFDKVIAHGLAGGTSSVLNGGKFGHGFVSAGLTQSLSEVDDIFVDSASELGDRMNNAIKAAIIGGTGSAITGGKFSNGAVTGAFSRLLNDDAFVKFETLEDKKLLEIDDIKLKLSLDFKDQTLIGIDNIDGLTSTEVNVEPLPISESGMSVNLSGKGPLSLQVSEQGLLVEGKVCTHGDSGLCGALSTAIKSPALRTVSRNVSIATTPVAVSNHLTGGVSYSNWFFEKLGMPAPIGVN